MCFKFCYAKFMEDTREKMLNNLLELSAEGQNIFLICHIEVVPAHRPKHVSSFCFLMFRTCYVSMCNCRESSRNLFATTICLPTREECEYARWCLRTHSTLAIKEFEYWITKQKPVPTMVGCENSGRRSKKLATFRWKNKNRVSFVMALIFVDRVFRK